MERGEGEEARRRLEEYEEALRRAENLRVPGLKNLWLEYDKNTDTLYIHFSKEEAEETIMIDDDTAVYVAGDRLVGIAIYNASKRLGIEQPY